MVTDVNATENSIYQKLSSQGMDGTSVISVSFTASSSFSSSTVSNSISPSKLPLILGVSIGVGLSGINSYI